MLEWVRRNAWIIVILVVLQVQIETEQDRTAAREAGIRRDMAANYQETVEKHNMLVQATSTAFSRVGVGTPVGPSGPWSASQTPAGRPELAVCRSCSGTGRGAAGLRCQLCKGTGTVYK